MDDAITNFMEICESYITQSEIVEFFAKSHNEDKFLKSLGRRRNTLRLLRQSANLAAGKIGDRATVQLIFELEEVAACESLDLQQLRGCLISLKAKLKTDEAINHKQKVRATFGISENQDESMEDDSFYRKALNIWNNQPEVTWPELREMMKGDGITDVDALRTGVRRFATKNNLNMRQGSPGRPKKK